MNRNPTLAAHAKVHPADISLQPSSGSGNDIRSRGGGGGGAVTHVTSCATAVVYASDEAALAADCDNDDEDTRTLFTAINTSASIGNSAAALNVTDMDYLD